MNQGQILSDTVTTAVTTATAGSTTSVIRLGSYPILAALFAYTGLSHEAIGILAVLLVLDVLTAIIRVAVKNPQALSSRIGIVGILSKCLTFMIPFVVVIVGKGAGFDMTKLATVMVSILIIYEGWSVIGNIGQIRSEDTTLNEYDSVSLLIKKIQVLFKNLLDNIFLNVENVSDKPQIPENKKIDSLD